MSNNPTKQLSQKKKIQSAHERIEGLEKALPQIVAGVNQALVNVDGSLAGIREVLEALVEIVGEDKVQAAIDGARARKAQESAEAARKGLEEHIAKGHLAKTDKIAENTVIIGNETDKDGNKVGVGDSIVSFSSMIPAFQEKLLGQGPGYVVDIPETGGRFEVLDIYSIVEKTQEPHPTGATDICDGCKADSCDGCPSSKPEKV